MAMESKNGNGKMMGKQGDTCGCCGMHHHHGGWFIVRIVFLIILLCIVFSAGVKLGELRATFGDSGWYGYGMMGSPYYGGGYYPGMMRTYGAPQATGTVPAGR